MLLDDDGAGAGGAHAPARPDVDVLNRKKQTPLMMAAMHGRTDCMLRLLDARTCLHHEAYYPMAMPTASKSSSLLPRPHRWPTHGNLATRQIDMAASLLACRGFAGS